MQFNKLVTGCLLAAAPAMVSADVLGFAIGAGVWNETPGGGIRKITETTDVSVKDDLFWTEESQGYLFATLEHPVPLLPNVRLNYVKLDHSGSGETGFGFDFDDISFSGNVANEFTIEQTDLLLYYEVLDNVVSLDLGLNVRLLDIAYSIVDENSNTTSGSVSAPVPMLYGLIGGTPWPGVLISAEGSFISYSGSTISDFNAKIAYTTNFLVGFEAGYRTQTIELDDVDDTTANLDFKGPFIGAYLKF
jgi:outer membrane protein